MTRRDAFWGAKIVMSFSDEDLRAIVETARISNPAAEAHLLDVLQQRRDKIGRYWFDKINPLDRFVVEAAPKNEGTQSDPDDLFALHFDDLAVTGGLEPASARRYRYQLHLDGAAVGASRAVEASPIPLAVNGVPLATVLDDRGRSGPHERVVRLDLQTVQNGDASSETRVYVYVPTDGAARVVGIQRL
jgi:hypothetical protein